MVIVIGTICVVSSKNCLMHNPWKALINSSPGHVAKKNIYQSWVQKTKWSLYRVRITTARQTILPLI